MQRGTLSFLLLLSLFASSTCLAEVEVIQDVTRSRVISLTVKEGKGERPISRAQTLREEQDPLALAAAYLRAYGEAFGVTDPASELSLKRIERDSSTSHLRFSQVYKGIPVLGGELIVHIMENGALSSINGDFVKGISLSTEPRFAKEEAVARASELWEERYGRAVPEALDPELYVISPAYLEKKEDGDARLAYQVRLRNVQAELDETFFIDGETGGLLYRFSNVRNATRREVYDCSNSSLGCVIDRYDPIHDYIFGRSEGQPARGVNPLIGSAADDLLYDRLEIVRRYYMDTFGRNGANGDGGLGDGRMVPVETVRAYLTPEDCPSGSYFLGSHLKLCQTSALINLVGHEYSHDVVSFLDYYGQSGSLNEGFAYISGEGFERYLTGAVDWLCAAEDVCCGNFGNPKVFCGLYDFTGAPDRFYDSAFRCSYLFDDFNIHWNAFVPVKAAYLAAEGGTFNGCTVTGIGIERVLQIWYRAYTQYFTPNTNFNDANAHLLEACESDPHYGPGPICDQVKKALSAVEMDQGGKCSGIPRVEPQCDLCAGVPNRLPGKTDPGCNGCAVADTDSDGDGTPDCYDECPTDPEKMTEGRCGCGAEDTDADLDGTPNCSDLCPADPGKIEAGACGCGTADTDSDSDGTADCNDGCPADPAKTSAGQCGCGIADTDSDSDGTANCNDLCPADPLKIEAGICGCGTADTDSDSDGTPDCNDGCPADPAKTSAGQCGCGDSDGGIVPAIPGLVEYLRIIKLKDSCLGRQYLIEYYCEPKLDIPSLRLVRCKSTCLKGTCKSSSINSLKKQDKRRQKQLKQKLKRKLKKQERKLGIS